MHATKLLTVLILSAAAAMPAHAASAFDAMKLLPKGEAKKLARIEAREGTPDPERWHLITHDEQSENGLREYVVAAGEVVASRRLSQFADSIEPEDVIGSDVVRFDSGKAAQVAYLYAAANNAVIAWIHYQLRKDGPEAVPLWTLICTDAGGREIGRLIVSATRGNVIAHDGFPIDPPPPLPTVATPAPAPVAKPRPKRKSPATPAVESARPEPPAAVAQRPGFMDRVRGSFQKVLPGRKTEDR